MRNWCGTFVISICLALSAMFTVNVLWDREPSANGKSLSEWALIYSHYAEVEPYAVNSAECVEAVAAVRSMSDHVLPYALRRVRHEKPRWHDRMVSFMENCGIRGWGPRVIWAPFYSDPGDDAIGYFHMLGADGSPAIPELVQIIKESKSWTVAEHACSALGGIGESALPAMMSIVTNKHSSHRRPAIGAMESMNSWQPGAAKPAVPLLAACLNDSDPDVAWAAIGALGRMALEPEISVPALAGCLEGRSAGVRSYAVESLLRFDDRRDLVVPVLEKALGDPDPSVRLAATVRLQEMSTAAESRIP